VETAGLGSPCKPDNSTMEYERGGIPSSRRAPPSIALRHSIDNSAVAARER